MKKALSIALVAALSCVLFLPVVYAQEEGAEEAVPGLLQELARMESVFNGLEGFMSELIGEVKTSMADIDVLEEDAADLREVLNAVTIELKAAEGRIARLRDDLTKMGFVQQEFQVRITALEAGLSELSAFCEALAAKVEITAQDVADLLEFKAVAAADISALKRCCEDLSIRVRALEDEDVGTFKKKVLELERSMSALAIKIDNNRAKLEGFDHAIASLAGEIGANKSGVLANMSLLEDHETRLMTLEDGTMLADLQDQLNTAYFLAIVGLLAGVGALVWGFMGT